MLTGQYQSNTVIAAMLLVVAMLMIQLAAPESIHWLRFDRAQVYAGQWWRIVSAHMVHAGWTHAVLNILAFVLVVAIFPLVRPWQWLILFIASLVATSSGLLLATNIAWYVGFSGVLHGLFAGAAILELENYRKFAVVLILVISGKLLYEWIAGALPGSELLTGVRVITEAHLWGALGGSLSALFIVARNRLQTIST